MRLILMIAGILISTAIFADDMTPRFGIATAYSGGKLCVTFQEHKLNLGQDIFFTGFRQPRWKKGKIVENNSERCEAKGGHSGVVYAVQLENVSDSTFEIGVAIASVGEQLSIRNNRPTVFTNVNSQPIIIRECTSMEGAHYSAWLGKHRIWHEYYYAGYDLVQTCTDEEAKE